jgi:pyruvate/2-oxoacid:ferredoxin oxidoreductase beta subunit
MLGKRENKNILVFAGDGGTFDIGLQALSGMFERGHKVTFICNDNEAYMNCLSPSSLIMTKKGLKRVADVRVGEEVYAIDQKSHDLVLKRCAGVFNNGVRDVYELETFHHSIKATLNHPFLVLKRNGRGKHNELVWKLLSELKPGDEIIVLKNLDGGSSAEFDFNPVKKGDYKVTHLNEVSLPSQSSPDLMKVLGLYVGDGWVRSARGEVGFALPEGSQGRKVLGDLQSALFDGTLREDEMYAYINSVSLARFIDSLGFGSGAKNKIIPPWVFTLPEAEKEDFVQGLLLSDGYKNGGSLRYTSSSFELLRRFRLLLQTMNYRVGKIHKQVKKKGDLCVGRELLKDSQYGYICFSKRDEWNTEKYTSQYKYQNFLVGNEHFEMERVNSVSYVGKEPTLDLRVEDEHNFIADGIIVHNTGIQRCSATPYGAWTTTSPPGKYSIGESKPKKPIARIAAAHCIPYVATATIAYVADYQKKLKKALAVDGPSFLHVLAPCPSGWRFASDELIEVSRLAVQTGVFALWEVENGEMENLRITKKIPQRKPVEEYLKTQGRFKHLFKPVLRKDVIGHIQAEIDKKFERFGL